MQSTIGLISIIKSVNNYHYTRIVYLVLMANMFVLSGYAQEEYRDTLMFDRGQMILGELLSIEEGRFNFDSDIVRVISIKHTRVSTFSGILHYYRIRTSDGRLIYGTAHKSDREGYVNIKTSSGLVEVPILTIIRLERYDSKFFQRITGDVSVGYNYTKSSDIGRLNLSTNIRYLAQKFISTLSLSSIMTQDKGSFSRDNENFTSTNQVNFSYRWIGVGLLSYQRNLELGIVRRYQEGLLFGYNITQFSNRQLSSSVGVALNQELTQDNTSSRNLVEIPFILAFNFYQFSNPDIQLTMNEKVYFGVTQQGRIRNDANLDVSWNIIRDFKLGVNLYYNYDNQPAETSTSNFDFGVVLNIGYKFGNAK